MSTHSVVVLSQFALEVCGRNFSPFSFDHYISTDGPQITNNSIRTCHEMCVCGMAWAEIDGKEQKGREKTEVTLGGKAYERALLLFPLSI